jgi:two-component system phosphate regulon response regulator PhoB
MSDRILLVDDDPEVVNLFSFALKRAGYEVDSALNGEEALQQVCRSRPALVVLDVMMPGTNGYEVAQRLRAQPETATLPIVMLTARALVPDQVRGIQAGATSYLVKPVMPSALVQTVRQILAMS